MPELPEVETVRRGLEGFLVGKRIVRVQVLQSKLRREVPATLATDLTRQVVVRINRRGKYLCWDLSNDLCVVSHLGMSGSFTLYSKETGSSFSPQCITKHDHLIFHLENNAVVTYNDPRRFGSFDIIHTNDLNTFSSLASLGVEPLGNEFSSCYLYESFRKKSVPVKVVLLDQTIIAGVGNIYASEALWRSGISPKRKTDRISEKSIQNLVAAIRSVLQEAIASGGSTLRNYRGVTGSLGYFQHKFNVYERDKLSCPKEDCEGIIKRIVQGGRSTYYCIKCQK